MHIYTLAHFGNGRCGARTEAAPPMCGVVALPRDRRGQDARILRESSRTKKRLLSVVDNVIAKTIAFMLCYWHDKLRKDF